MKKAFSILFTLAMASACSYQTRTSDPGVSGDQVLSQLGQFTGTTAASADGTSSVQIANSGSTGDTSTVQSLAEDPNSIVFFAEGMRSADWQSTGPMGSPVTVAAFVDFSVFGLQSVNAAQIQDVQVFFIEDGGQAGLLVAISTFDNPGNYTVTAFTGPSSTSGDGYTAQLDGPNGSMTVNTSDVDKNGGLLDTIQLKVNRSDGTAIGQFSALAGFTH